MGARWDGDEMPCCPHCDEFVSTEYLDFRMSGDAAERECDSCGKPYWIKIRMLYTTRKPDGWAQDDEDQDDMEQQP